MVDRRHLMQGFHKISRQQRVERLKEFADLSEAEVDLLMGHTPFSTDIAEHLVENVIGYYPLPLGVACYFRIDGRDTFVPMAVEESSVIAAASGTAKWVCSQGSIRTYSKGRMIIGQIQIPSLKDVERVRTILSDNRNFFISLANELVPGLVSRGGGVRDIAVRVLPKVDGSGPMLVVHVLCDPCDAMGANLITQVCEGLKPSIEQLTGERVGICILSNLVDGKLAGAEVVIHDVEKRIADGIIEATQFAKSDPYRAATHNKGVLNGIDPILIATGNDWRAVEAGIHAYAARRGRYEPITDWRLEGTDLIGSIEVPLAVGTVGGVTAVHPLAKLALKIMGVRRAEDLARICAAVGLVQNLGALKALSTVGIIKGHMKLHASNLAIAAGAQIHEIAEVRERLNEVLAREKRINLTHAKEILAHVRSKRDPSVEL